MRCPAFYVYSRRAVPVAVNPSRAKGEFCRIDFKYVARFQHLVYWQFLPHLIRDIELLKVLYFYLSLLDIKIYIDFSNSYFNLIFIYGCFLPHPYCCVFFFLFFSPLVMFARGLSILDLSKEATLGFLYQFYHFYFFNPSSLVFIFYEFLTPNFIK